MFEADIDKCQKFCYYHAAKIAEGFFCNFSKHSELQNTTHLGKQSA